MYYKERPQIYRSSIEEAWQHSHEWQHLIHVLKYRKITQILAQIIKNASAFIWNHSNTALDFVESGNINGLYEIFELFDFLLQQINRNFFIFDNTHDL